MKLIFVEIFVEGGFGFKHEVDKFPTRLSVKDDTVGRISDHMIFVEDNRMVTSWGFVDVVNEGLDVREFG
jgi:hypothetical protein